MKNQQKYPHNHVYHPSPPQHYSVVLTCTHSVAAEPDGHVRRTCGVADACGAGVGVAGIGVRVDGIGFGVAVGVGGNAANENADRLIASDPRKLMVPVAWTCGDRPKGCMCTNIKSGCVSAPAKMSTVIHSHTQQAAADAKRNGVTHCESTLHVPCDVIA